MECKIPLTNKATGVTEYALVSPQDYEELVKHKWHVHVCKRSTNGLRYAKSSINQKCIM